MQADTLTDRFTAIRKAAALLGSRPGSKLLCSVDTPAQLDAFPPGRQDDLVWVSSSAEVEALLIERGHEVILLSPSLDVLATAMFATVTAVARGLLRPDEHLTFYAAGAGADSGLVMTYRADEQFPVVAALDWDDAVEPQILCSVLELAIELGSVRDASVSGTIFTVGDEAAVLGMQAPYTFEPFHAYPAEERHILDRDVRSNIKKLTKVEGAFIVSGTGTVECLSRIFYPTHKSEHVDPGLGTRHSRSADLSASTKAYVIVVSTSQGKVTVYKGGRAVSVIQP